MVQEMVYFKTDGSGPKGLFDAQGKIGDFTKRSGAIERLSDGTAVRGRMQDEVWIMEIPKEDTETIARIQKYPGYGRRFHQISHLPDAKNVSNVHAGIGNLAKLEAEMELKAKAEAKAIAEESKAKYKRYYQLESKLLKKDGTPIKGSKPEELQELEELKQELEL